MSAAVLTLQSVLLIGWAQWLVVDNRGTAEFVGTVLLVGIGVGAAAIYRAWTIR